MSYFIFGTFDMIDNESEEILQSLKEYGKEKDIYIWFNEEIAFYKEIPIMLKEQNAEGNIKFAVTSLCQPRNSSDLLFPFDKINSEVLFADKTRKYFEKCCKDNISILINYLKKIKKLYNIEHWKVFIVEGYDDIFKKKICNIDEMEKDLLQQIQNNMSIESCVYHIYK